MSVCVFPEHVMCTPSRLEWDRSVLAAPSSPPDLVGWAFILLLESSWPLSTPLNAISHSISLFITLSLFLTPFSLPPRLLLRPCCLEHCAHAKGINMPIRAQGSEQKWLLGEYQSISDHCLCEAELVPAGKMLDPAVCVRMRQPGRWAGPVKTRTHTSVSKVACYCMYECLVFWS